MPVWIDQLRASRRTSPNIVYITNCLDKFGCELALLLADSSCDLLLLLASKKELFSSCKECPRDTFANIIFGILLIIENEDDEGNDNEDNVVFALDCAWITMVWVKSLRWSVCLD